MEKELHRSIVGPGQRWHRTTGALLSALFGVALLLLGSRLAQLSYDLIFRGQSARPRSEVVIVYMDEASHRDLNQPWGSVWDRSLHARLLDRLRDSGANMVVFDILFADAGRDPSVDQSLADAIRSHGKVVLAGVEELRRSRDQFVGREVHSPHQSFRKEAAGIGLATMIVDPDGVIRQATVKSAAGLPSLALAAVAVLDNTAASSKPPTPCWLNYYGPPGSIAHVSYIDVLHANRLPRGFFDGKVVFVGIPSRVGFAGDRDAFSTPFTRWQGSSAPGVEIQATAFLNFLHEEWLTRWSPVAEIGLVMLFGAGFGYGLARLRARQCFLVSLVGCLIVVLAACALFRLAHVWSPWLVVVAQIIFATVWSLFIRALTRFRPRRVPEQSFATGSVLWN